jgi:hypothetical protein
VKGEHRQDNEQETPRDATVMSRPYYRYPDNRSAVFSTGCESRRSFVSESNLSVLDEAEAVGGVLPQAAGIL